MDDVYLQALCQLLNSARNNAGVSFFFAPLITFRGRKRQLMGTIIVGVLVYMRHYGAQYARYAPSWCILCETYSETSGISGA